MPKSTNDQDVRATPRALVAKATMTQDPIWFVLREGQGGFLRTYMGVFLHELEAYQFARDKAKVDGGKIIVYCESCPAGELREAMINHHNAKASESEWERAREDERKWLEKDGFEVADAD